MKSAKLTLILHTDSGHSQAEGDLNEEHLRTYIELSVRLSKVRNALSAAKGILDKERLETEQRLQNSKQGEVLLGERLVVPP